MENTLVVSRGRSTLPPGPAEEVYGEWDSPDPIVSDGAYGVGGFPGDPRTPDGLEEWYAEHVVAWSKHAHPATTLWFWNTEIGWATVHPPSGTGRPGIRPDDSVGQGIGHIAGNMNGDTIRRLPTVTEVCAFYRRRLAFTTPDAAMSACRWLRSERM